MLDISKTAAFEEKQETDLKTIYTFETDFINVISSDCYRATANVGFSSGNGDGNNLLLQKEFLQTSSFSPILPFPSFFGQFQGKFNIFLLYRHIHELT